jgi:flagellar basal-body rod modification protein FlgD
MNEINTSTNSTVSNAITSQSAQAQAENSILFSQALAESGSSASGAGTSSEEVGAENDATEDRFLALLVAQMRNQDPMNPLENAEVTTQLAQINTVRGIEGLGSTMEQLLGKFDNTNPVDSAAMIGRQVLLPGNTLTVTEGDDQQLVGGAYVPVSTSGVTAQIVGENGEVVRRIDLGPKAAGVATFNWDGNDDHGDAVDAGSYRLQLMGTSANGIVDLEPLAGAQVTGITRGEDSILYRVNGGASVPAESVLGIF